jgi:hypothetical protein
MINISRLNSYARETLTLFDNPHTRPFLRTGGTDPMEPGKVSADIYEVSKNADDACIETLLSTMVANGMRIKITYRDGSIIRCKLGRSTGRIKLLLAMKTERSIGGEAILTGFIDRIEIEPRHRRGWNFTFPRDGILYDRTKGRLWGASSTARGAA